MITEIRLITRNSRQTQEPDHFVIEKPIGPVLIWSLKGELKFETKHYSGLGLQRWTLIKITRIQLRLEL